MHEIYYGETLFHFWLRQGSLVPFVHNYVLALSTFNIFCLDVGTEVKLNLQVEAERSYHRSALATLEKLYNEVWSYTSFFFNLR